MLCLCFCNDDVALFFFFKVLLSLLGLFSIHHMVYSEIISSTINSTLKNYSTLS